MLATSVKVSAIRARGTYATAADAVKATSRARPPPPDRHRQRGGELPHEDELDRLLGHGGRGNTAPRGPGEPLGLSPSPVLRRAHAGCLLARKDAESLAQEIGLILR